MEEVPRRTSLVPLAFPCCVLCLIAVETEGLLDYQGRAGIISIVRWNLCPVIFGVEHLQLFQAKLSQGQRAEQLVPGLKLEEMLGGGCIAQARSICMQSCTTGRNASESQRLYVL